jgi:hypothetical protein
MALLGLNQSYRSVGVGALCAICSETYRPSDPVLSLSIVGHLDLRARNHGARIAVDRGAVRALKVARRSLLASGVVDVGGADGKLRG